MLKKSLYLLLRFLLILVGISLVSYLLSYLAPGDPAKNMLSAQGIPYTNELLEAKRLEFGFQDPFWIQYSRWLARALQGDLGQTYHSGSSVTQELLFYFPHTIVLAISSLALTLGISLPSAFYLARGGDSLPAKLLRGCVTVVNALPNFVMGIVLLLIFSLQLRALPVQSSLTVEGLILPSLTLALTMSSRYIPQLEEQLGHIFASDSVAGARGRGLSEGQVLRTTVFPQLSPLLISLVSLSLNSLLGGVAVVEYLFSWPGIGRMLITAVLNRDFPLIQGAVLVITVSVLVINTLGEWLQLLANPKAAREEA